MHGLTLALAGLLAGAPPLSPEQETRLATARDGRDHQDEAFVALVEHVRSWPEDLGDAAIRIRPDYDAMLEAPAAFRGDLCRVRGAIQQRNTLRAPDPQVTAWFLRTDDGRPLLVYVVDAPATSDTFRDGQVVTIDARFYKRVELTARDGRSRSYPAFVGAFPRHVPAGGAADIRQLWMLVVPLALL
ncbi:MAG: hypothetical protein ACYTGC_06050, partial [Planctomycetota bacterium]